MPSLPQALDAALRARYMPRAIKSAITTARGLTARLNALERHFRQPGDRKGAETKRVAAALGVSPVTYRRWRNGKQRPNLGKIEAAHHRLIVLPQMRRRLKDAPPPNKVNVRADVTWNGYQNRTVERTVKLDGMQGVMARTVRAWATAGPEAAADVFQRGTATVHHVPNSDDEPGIKFEGDNVEITFPQENQ
jgi:transcriptional regulator with XRE-family HTH domain